MSIMESSQPRPPVGRPETDFREQLLELIPAMRAFARSLCRNRDEADDLAQDALYRALQSWRTFQPDTNLKAWVFTILRNRFYSTRRTAGRETALDPEFAERTLLSPDDPYARFELDLVRRGLSQLPEEQREAILLICAAGLTYDQAAEVSGVPIGTVKSRLSRGRATLVALVATGDVGLADGIAPSDAFSIIVGQAAGMLAPTDDTPVRPTRHKMSGERLKNQA
ncbi:MAG: polymerase sigma-70 factor, subfamily [Caulobacter sp.]|nr:polymerase sigma-70 factor, subfamily [Caulobacter sp.]